MKIIAKDVFFSYLAEEIKENSLDSIEGSGISPETAALLCSLYIKSNKLEDRMETLMTDYSIDLSRHISINFLQEINNEVTKAWQNFLSLENLYNIDKDLTKEFIFYMIGESFSSARHENLKNRLLELKVSLPQQKCQYDYKPVWTVLSFIGKKIETNECQKTEPSVVNLAAA